LGARKANDGARLCCDRRLAIAPRANLERRGGERPWRCGRARHERDGNERCPKDSHERIVARRRKRVKLVGAGGQMRRCSPRGDWRPQG
jgi:hypothetical protein